MADFLASLPLSELRRLLSRSEDKKRGFSDAGARISLLLDVAKGQVRSQRQYAEDWGWSHKRVRYHWPELWHEVADWCSSYGRQMDGPLARNLPPPWQAYLDVRYHGEGRAKDAPGAQETPVPAQTEGKGAHPRQSEESQGHKRGTEGARKTAIPAQKERKGAHEGHKRGTAPSHNARARYPIPNPTTKDLSNAAAAFATVDSRKTAESAAAAFDLDLDETEGRTADAEILSFCQSIGLSEAVAGRIASHPDAAYVRAQIASYQAAKGKGPGWFVRAVDEGYDLRAEATGAPARSRRKPETGQAASATNPVPARPLLDNLDDL